MYDAQVFKLIGQKDTNTYTTLKLIYVALRCDLAVRVGHWTWYGQVKLPCCKVWRILPDTVHGYGNINVFDVASRLGGLTIIT